MKVIVPLAPQALRNRQHAPAEPRGGPALGLAMLLLAGSLAVTQAAEGGAWGLRDRPVQPSVVPAAAVVGKAAIADPAGDTFGTGAINIDVTSFSATTIEDELVLALGFAEAIAPPSSDAANAIAGFIDLDVDNNAATGEASFVDFVAGLESGTGSDFHVDLLSYDAADGAVDLVTAAGAVAGRVAMTLSANTLAVRVPLALMADDGAVRAVAVVGTHAEATDAVPNGGYLNSELPGGTVLLNGGRFAVEVTWKDFAGATGSGELGVRSEDSAVFWFFSETNWELMVKVLDGCSINQQVWVFAAATTNVEYTLTVTDTQTGVQRRYVNPLGTAASAVNDTDAFSSCS